MQFESFHQWVQQIYATRDEELDCDEFLDAIPQYVDMEIAGDAANPHLPEVEIHLGHCHHCKDLYLTLRDVALLEDRQTTLADQQVALADQQVTQQLSPGLATGGIPQPDAPTNVIDSPLPGEMAS